MSGNYYYSFFAGYYATERAADVLQQYRYSCAGRQVTGDTAKRMQLRGFVRSCRWGVGCKGAGAKRFADRTLDGETI